MSENCVTKEMCEAHRELNTERLARDKERLDKLEALTTKVSECSIRLSEMVEADHEKIADHDQRLTEIENRPRDWIDKVISGAIAAVVAFLMGVILK